jgi:hypothetical protein
MYLNRIRNAFLRHDHPPPSSMEITKTYIKEETIQRDGDHPNGRNEESITIYHFIMLK